jgi:diguanylate cyclase (GGDEF)-like protein
MTNESPSSSASCSNCAQLRQQLQQKDAEVARLQAQIAELGRHDSLTGALNRRTLVEVLEAELQRAQRTGHPFCVAVLELDDFAAFVERHGHAGGDALLKAATDTAVKLLRTVDRFGRLGGEEFGILLPATWLDQGMIAMQRLAKAMGDCKSDALAADTPLAFSAGLTTNAFGDTAESMLARAGEAREQARLAGGNRIVQAEEPLPDAPIVLD